MLSGGEERDQRGREIKADQVKSNPEGKCIICTATCMPCKVSYYLSIRSSPSSLALIASSLVLLPSAWRVFTSTAD